MDGGLEAKINEGGKSHPVSFFSCSPFPALSIGCSKPARPPLFHISTHCGLLCTVMLYSIGSPPCIAPPGRHVLTSLLGSNLSQGQRQLVSLARAMLTPSNILVLDEATAAVDVQTDALLQQTLRGPMFSNRTIITVAHRINTILDSDRVVVLQRGEVAEFDTPENLIKEKGIFYSLVKEAGLTE